MIKLYIYRKSDGAFLYSDMGSAGSVLHDVSSDKDFTLEPPPNYEKQWYWQNNQWTTQPAQSV